VVAENRKEYADRVSKTDSNQQSNTAQYSRRGLGAVIIILSRWAEGGNSDRRNFWMHRGNYQGLGGSLALKGPDRGVWIPATTLWKKKQRANESKKNGNTRGNGLVKPD